MARKSGKKKPEKAVKITDLKAFKVPERKKPALLFSIHNYPITISYAGKGMVLPPKVRNLSVDNKDLLGALPKGVFVK
ncbi:MAG: hypothetical protein ACW991_02865 [Candidatus Hodarchaeales archaeon]|jgi:hypothetical protein